MRIGLLAIVMLAAYVLIDVGLWVFSRGGFATSSVAASVGSSPSQVPRATATAAGSPGASATLPPEMTPIPIPGTGRDLSWERVATFGGAPNVFITGLAKGPGGYVAVGAKVDGAMTELGNQAPTAPRLWRSADGITWIDGDPAPFGTDFASGITSDGTQYLVMATKDASTHLYRSLDGVAWHLVEGTWGAAGGYVRKLIVGPSGFVGIGAVGASGHAAFWSSPDGTQWTLVKQESDTSQVSDVAAGANGVVAVGIVVGEGGRNRQAVWYSSDGVTWGRHDPTALGNGDLEAVLATSHGFVAGGWVWDVGFVMWRSEDGMHWSPAPAQAMLGPDLPGDAGSLQGAAFAFGGAIYVTGYASCCGDPPQRTYLSTDGVLWARIHRRPASATVHFGTVMVEGKRVVAAGNVHGRSGLGETGGIWIGRAP